MPALGSVLSADERWDVIAHVLTLSDSMARRAGNGTAAIMAVVLRSGSPGQRRSAKRSKAA